MAWRPLLLTIWAGLIFLTGCSSGSSSPWEAGYSYYPQPVTLNVRRVGSNQPSPLTVLATILGVRNAEPKQYIPYSVAVRIRFDNVGQSRISFDPRTLELVTGTLVSFPPAVVEPPQPFELLPDQRRDLTAYFPFPANTTASQMSLQNLRVRWEVKIDDVAVPQTAIFNRIEGPPPPGPDPNVSY
jgi:hypothetical protein